MDCQCVAVPVHAGGDGQDEQGEDDDAREEQVRVRGSCGSTGGERARFGTGRERNVMRLRKPRSGSRPGRRKRTMRVGTGRYATASPPESPPSCAGRGRDPAGAEAQDLARPDDGRASCSSCRPRGRPVVDDGPVDRGVGRHDDDDRRCPRRARSRGTEAIDVPSGASRNVGTCGSWYVTDAPRPMRPAMTSAAGVLRASRTFGLKATPMTPTRAPLSGPAALVERLGRRDRRRGAASRG